MWARHPSGVQNDAFTDSLNNNNGYLQIHAEHVPISMVQELVYLARLSRLFRPHDKSIADGQHFSDVAVVPFE